MDLKDKVAMITGAAQGIGKATALVLAAYGADIVACDVNSKGINLYQNRTPIFFWDTPSCFFFIDIECPKF